jgi:protein-S-isoprenylcysteine O-methyltransferase Ste14
VLAYVPRQPAARLIFDVGKMLLARAIFAFLALPAVVAGVVPALLVQGISVAGWLVVPGSMLLTVGGVLLVWCARDFFVAGRGTLAPWDPPKHLVVVGLYRFVRNPMYEAVLVVVAGWSVLYASVWLALYAVGLALGFHLRVRWHEEPRLSRQFGAEWEAYADRTARWLPRLGSMGKSGHRRHPN